MMQNLRKEARPLNSRIVKWIPEVCGAILIFFIAISCQVQPLAEQPAGAEHNLPDSKSKTGLTTLAGTVSISKLELAMSVSGAATGNVIVELRDGSGSQVLASATVDCGYMVRDQISWQSFNFPISLQLERGLKYRIYVKRDVHVTEPSPNSIFLSASDVNAYGAGNSSLGEKDFGFITYNENEIDQSNVAIRQGWLLDDVNYFWQEFTPGAISLQIPVRLSSIDLNLAVGSNSTGSVTAEIHSVSGNNSAVIASTSTPWYSLAPGAGSFWDKFVFNSTIYVIKGQTYKIYVKRTGTTARPSATDFVTWGVCRKTCDFNSDFYPFGISSVFCDFAFKTFTPSGQDQVQRTITHSIPLQPNVAQWQEFVPGAGQ